MSLSESTLAQADAAVADPAATMAESGERTDGVKLPFTFAKQYGVLLDRSSSPPVVVHREFPLAIVLAELRRFLGCSFELQAANKPKLHKLRLRLGILLEMLCARLRGGAGNLAFRRRPWEFADSR